MLVPEIVVAVLGVAAKLERRHILEHTARGRADAKAKGGKFAASLPSHRTSRKRPVSASKRAKTQRSVARSYNVGQSTISRLSL